jgi:hypothetical protein
MCITFQNDQKLITKKLTLSHPSLHVAIMTHFRGNLLKIIINCFQQISFDNIIIFFFH